MLKKLQIKFVIINMTIVTFMLVIIFGLVYNFTQYNLETENINMMKTIAANPFDAGRPNDSSSNLKLPFFALHLGLDGDLISTDGGYYDLSDRIFLNDLINESLPNRQEIGVIENHNLRYYKLKMPMGTILVFSDMSSEKNTLNNLLQTFAVIGCISFFVFLGISILLAKWAVRPVALSWQQQKQFIADASHELKTPLTVITTNAELLQSKEYTENERNNFLQSISLMSGQMKQLVEKMLILAKSDDQSSAIVMHPLDLSRLVLNTALSFEGVFIEQGLTLKEQIEPDIMISGNEQSLQQVVDILLDNAQKYSSPGGTTSISLCTIHHGKCQLRVSNPGTEIPPEDLCKIFQRFYRMDQARSRNGSFGLGLSIAENIVLQHKGKIFAESQNGVNTFIVELRKKL